MSLGVFCSEFQRRSPDSNSQLPPVQAVRGKRLSRRPADSPTDPKGTSSVRWSITNPMDAMPTPWVSRDLRGGSPQASEKVAATTVQYILRCRSIDGTSPSPESFHRYAYSAPL